MISRRDAQLRHARLYCTLAQQYKASGRKRDIGEDYANILIGLETSEKYQDYELLASYVRVLSDIWKGSEWPQYKHWVPLVLNLTHVETTEKSRYLTHLSLIEESQGNYEEAKKLLEKNFFLLMESKDHRNEDGLFEIALRIASLAKKLDNYDKLETVLLGMLEIAKANNDLQQQVDILLELAVIPEIKNSYQKRSEERRVGKECRSRWSPYH